MKFSQLIAVFGICASLATATTAQAFDGLGRMDGPHLGWGDGLGLHHLGPRGLRPHILPRSERELRHPLRSARFGRPHLYGWGYGEGFGYHGLWPRHHGFGSPYRDSFGSPWTEDDHSEVSGGTGDDAAAAKCAQHFRSYNPATRTYLGYDGKRHACP